MIDEKLFTDWCIRLERETGFSYKLVYAVHLEQIKNNWNNLIDENAESINAVMVYLLQHSHTGFLIDLIRLLESQMTDGKLLLLRLKMYVNSGIAHNMQNKIEEAEACYLKAIEASKAISNVDEAEAQNVLGSIYYNYARLKLSKDRNSVNDYLEKAVSHFKKGGYQPGLASCLSLKAVLLPSNAYQERINLFLQAAEINKSLEMMNDYAMRLANVGIEFVNIGDFQTGIGYLERSLEVNLQNRSAHHLGMNYLMIADAYKKKGDYEIAKDYCRLAQNELHSANIFSYDNDIEKIKLELR